MRDNKRQERSAVEELEESGELSSVERRKQRTEFAIMWLEEYRGKHI